MNRLRRVVLPGWLWLLLPALVLWPVWQWSLRRMSDGSDDPFGLVALATLLLMLWRERRQLRATPRLPWLCLALLLSTAALLSQAWLPPLLRSVLAVLALFAAIMSVRVAGQALLAWLGLGLLALPILSSLQFFAGYPLRLLTAEASAWLLRFGGLVVIRQGSALDVGGQLVMVDAPCSGIQMAWVAYFTAFATAAWLGLADRRLLRRIPLLGVLVLGGNILRNSLLVLQETGRLGLPGWMHEGIGLLVFVVVCVLVLRFVAAAAEPAVAAAPVVPAEHPVSHRAQAGLALAFLLLSGVPWLVAQPESTLRSGGFVEWPQHFDGRPLQPLALSAVEQRFAAQFPGAIARFSAGSQVVTLRHVTRATRKLHPAADCYRGLGYRIQAISLQRRPDRSGLQRCFVASREGQALRVCEYIEDAAGQSFSDNSAWYWSALAGRSPGPWRAVTIAQAM